MNTMVEKFQTKPESLDTDLPSRTGKLQVVQVGYLLKDRNLSLLELLLFYPPVTTILERMSVSNSCHQRGGSGSSKMCQQNPDQVLK